MPSSPHQIAVVVFQLLLLLGGTWWLARLIALPAARQAMLGHYRIPPWPLRGFEVALLLITIFLCGLVGHGALVQLLGPTVRAAADRSGLEIVMFGVGFHGFALLGWPLFHALRRHLLADYGVVAPPAASARAVASGSWLRFGAAALIIILPLVAASSLGWVKLLRMLGLPDEPQDLIAIFGGVDSVLVFVAMLVVACVLAPINEELIFRGLIFRYCRQRFGRGFALGVSSVLFGAMHGNWAGFVPLAVLGAGLALAYEQTGDIRVPIVAHALFNLNTILVILSGLPQA